MSDLCVTTLSSATVSWTISRRSVARNAWPRFLR